MQYVFFVVILTPFNSFSIVSLSYIFFKAQRLAPPSRLEYRLSESLNSDGRLVTKIRASYLKIAM